MSAEQRVQLLIGQQVFQIAVMADDLEKAKAELAKATARIAELENPNDRA